jgi:hypothetical protein
MTTTLCQSATTALQLLQRFLLHGSVQLQQGPEAGGVAGTVPGGEVVYVYGEITGYYLHWLASRPAPQAECARAAQAALDWLQHYLLMQPVPPTRLYLQPQPHDWRNEALFAFDLAMIAGGIARVAGQGLGKADAALIHRLDALLQQFVADDELKVIVTRLDVTRLPQRWSTVGGPFTAKTASRILQLDAIAPLHTPLVQQCRQQLQRYADMADAMPPEMLHPTLYALEGMLLAAAPDWEKLARGLQRVLDLQAPDGSLPEAPDSTQIRRNDVAAQALRLAILLEHQLGDVQRFDASIHLLASWLCQQILPQGTLAFAPGPGNPPNTWCAMFAEQALRLYVARETAQPLPLTAADVV